MTKLTYTRRETAHLLGIPESTFYRAVREGKATHLRPITVGNKVIFPKKIIDALVAGEAA